MVVQPTAAASASKTLMKVGMAAIAMAVSKTAKTSIAMRTIRMRAWGLPVGVLDLSGEMVIDVSGRWGGVGSSAG
nr:hypothetical protein GCM10010200_037570 [Actinomadura rugatobispora]